MWVLLCAIGTTEKIIERSSQMDNFIVIMSPILSLISTDS